MDLEQYQALIDHAPTMLWRATVDGERAHFNRAWLAFTGRSLEQELGDGWLEGVWADDAETWLLLHREHLDRRVPFELSYRLRRFDGSYARVRERVAPLTDRSGVHLGFVGVCTEVEDLPDPETAHRAHEFFEMSLDLLCVAGFDGYFRRLNPSWSRTLGWTPEEMMAQPSIELVHPEDREATLGGRTRLTLGTGMGPLVNRYRCKDGSYRFFEWRSVAHVDRQVVYAAARDVTEQKRAEQSLREAKERQESLERQLIFADRMASVGTLAAGVAHEINNPLAAVSANIGMIVDDLAELRATMPSGALDELEEMAIQVQAGAERIRKIVLGLRTFSRGEEQQRVVFELPPVLELSIDMTHNEIRHRARLVKDFGPSPAVEGDDARLAQVFINLLVNATQALPEGAAEAHEIRVVTATDAEGRAVIEVHDTGAGIAPNLLERIFDPFFTTKPVGVGTGLGLWICHDIVASMGGEISVTSELGRGSRFRVTLPPAQRAQVRAVERPPRRLRTSTPRGAVLVIDDEPIVGAALRRVLRDHAVTTVTTAQEALDLLRSGERFDVILSDVMMPEMSGMDFYDELERTLPEAAGRVVFVSGGAFTPAAQAFLERVTNERIEKPFDPQQLRDLVQRLVG